MAVYKIFPLQDATLYSGYPTMNTGRDSILEVSSTYPSTVSNPIVARPLIQFDQSQIDSVIDTYVEGETAISSSLRAFIADASGVVMQSDIEIYPVSGSWNNGSGEYLDNPHTTNGVSWEFRNFSGSAAEGTLKWNMTGASGSAVTMSFSGSINEGGGNWYTASATTASVSEQTFSYGNSTDLNVNVTNIVKSWFDYSVDPSTGLKNDGFLVKQQDSREFVNSKNTTATFRYFSIDTNTIYPPQLEFRYDDYVFDTGSSTNTILGSQEAFMSIYNNDGVYYSESVARFRIAAIPKYPDRVFQTASLYTTNFYLPENSSSYAIKDTETNEFVIDFDDKFTNISVDATSSYFDVFMSGLEPERYYTVLIKTKLDGTTQVFDEDIMFKVVNG